jgi:N-acetylmuramoyl-L-alanine amidase
MAFLAVLSSESGQGAEYHYDQDVKQIGHIREGEVVYLSLMDISEAFGLDISYDPMAFEALVSSGTDRLTVPLFSHYLLLNGRLRNIIYPALYVEGDLYLPAMTSVAVLGDLTRLTLVWDDKLLVIRASQPQHNVVDVQFSPRSNGYLCEIYLAHPLEYEVLRSEGNWLQVTLQGGKLNEKRISNLPHSRAVRRIRAFQFENSAQVSIRFRREITEITHNLALNPPRLQVMIIDTMFDYTSLDTIFTEEEFDPIDVIVIDPGHGGIEDGAIGPQDLKEKDVVLDISLRLKELFEKEQGIDVILTREADTTLLLDERAAIANTSEGDLFISVHCNSFTERSAKGSQTFFLAAALNDAARATAMLENRSIMVSKEPDKPDSLDDLSFILYDLLQTEYLEESQALAGEIQNSMIKSLRTRDRGIDQAGFFMLNKVFMPSVLIEVAFISNKHEETLLKKDSFRQKAAEGIYRGIKNFIDKYSPDSYKTDR